MNVDPEDLLPKLPKPKDLQPFPTTQSIVSTFIEQLSHSYGLKVCLSAQWLEQQNIMTYVAAKGNIHIFIKSPDLNVWMPSSTCLRHIGSDPGYRCH